MAAPAGASCERVATTARRTTQPEPTLAAGPPRRRHAPNQVGSNALKEQLKTLADDVLAERVEPKAGAVVTQIANAYTRLLELEKKFKEHEEFEARLAHVEEEERRLWESLKAYKRG